MNIIMKRLILGSNKILASQETNHVAVVAKDI